MGRRSWHDSLTTEEKDHIVILAILEYLIQVATLPLQDKEVKAMLEVLEKRWGVRTADYHTIDWEDAT